MPKDLHLSKDKFRTVTKTTGIGGCVIGCAVRVILGSIDRVCTWDCGYVVCIFNFGSNLEIKMLADEGC